VSTKAQANTRHDFVDALRGVAVVFMLWMHTGDGWLQPALRQGTGWDLVRTFGGLAAPLFLLLAGVSLGLGWRDDRRAMRWGVARGLQIVVLGYGLRVQMWMLDGAGYRFGHHWVASLTLVLGYALAYMGLSRWAAGGRPGRWLLAAAPCIGLGVLLVSHWIPGRFIGVFRVDVLQAIGASLALLALYAYRVRGHAGAVLALGCAVLALTPWMRSWVPGPLPAPLAGYLGYWYPGPGRVPVGMFPLFPWLAYPCVGLVLGRHWGRVGPQAAADSAVLLCAPGALLALATCEAFAPVKGALDAWPVLLQPARVAYRVGICVALAALAVLLSRPASPVRKPLSWLGRASLMVYWVHLELAFGMLGRPLVRQLDFAAWATAWTVLTGAMTGLAWLWLRLRRRASERLPIAPKSPVLTA
jgi:uncharacterized membrane protein